MTTRYKLDIFDTLRAIDRKDMLFFDQLSDDQKKGFQPLVVMRWLSAIKNPNYADYYIYAVNERVNLNFFDITDPSMHYKAMVTCGLGVAQSHEWIPMPKRVVVKSDVLDDVILQKYPLANDQEIDLILSKLNSETFQTFVEELGYQDSEVKDLVDAYEKYTGNGGGKKRNQKKTTKTGQRKKTKK